MEPGQPTAPRCSTCEVEILWQPVIHREHPYCCGGCAQGGPCYCSYDLMTMDREWAPVPETADGQSIGPPERLSAPRGSAPDRS